MKDASHNVLPGSGCHVSGNRMSGGYGIRVTNCDTKDVLRAIDNQAVCIHFYFAMLASVFIRDSRPMASAVLWWLAIVLIAVHVTLRITSRMRELRNS